MDDIWYDGKDSDDLNKACDQEPITSESMAKYLL
jgi:hypothetical protein